MWLAAVINSSDDAIIGKTLDGIIISWNRGAQNIYGYSAKEVVGRSISTLVPPDRSDEVPIILEKLRRGERVDHYETERVRKDGERIHVSLTISPVKDSTGKIVGASTIARDITERKQAEEEIQRLNKTLESRVAERTARLEAAIAESKESEERFRLLVQNSSDIISVFDAEGTVIYQSPSIERILGHKPEDRVGKNIFDSPLVHPDDLASKLDFFTSARDNHGIEVRASFRLRHADGSWRHIEAVGKNLLHVPSVRGIIANYRDVTERKWAEEEIKMRAHQQATVAEFGLRALAETDLQALFDETVGMLCQTLSADYCKVLELLPDGEELLLRAGVGWKEGLVGKATVGAGLNSQAGYTLLSNEPVIVEDLHTESRFSGPPLLHEHGVVSGMSVVIQGQEGPFGVLGVHAKSHRTFSKDDVNFLQAVANVLAAAVERKEAEEKLREVREAERRRMARDLHDEALQDLSYALGEAQLVQMDLEEPKLDHRLEQVSQALKRAGQGLRGAIYDLRLEDEDRQQNFAEMLETIVKLARQSLPPGCKVELFVEENFALPLPRAKEAELLRIVREALANARRHSEARRVRVAAGASKGKLWAEVSDDGRGFDLKEAPSGMGTKGMRERARALGGELKIISKPGEGTRVLFELDLQRKEPQEEEARILLVEDHASLRQAVASMLEREPGFTVVGQAGSVAEARQMLNGADVAIVDLGLPDGYGGELIKELRALNPQAQALVLSASLDKPQIARAVECGAAGVLHKAAGMDEIADAVRRLRAGETLLPLEEIVELLRFASHRKEQEHEARQAVARLTPREKEVLQALAEGLDRQEIAQRLHISIETERNHMASILAKLGVHSRLQALVFAVRHSVVGIR